jgi:putative proteasome-type protease
MTYCVGVKLEEGLIFASDSRTHAGVDNYAKFCKMTVFERRRSRAGIAQFRRPGCTQAVINVLRRASGCSRRTLDGDLDVRCGQSGGRRHARHRAPRQPIPGNGGLKFNASFILGGQIAGEEMRLFRIYAEGNFIEAGSDTNFLQTGEAKYGKPILDLAVTPTATLENASKCVLVSFDSTMLSNLSVGMPIDLLVLRPRQPEGHDEAPFRHRRQLLRALKQQWIAGTRKVFSELPPLQW